MSQKRSSYVKRLFSDFAHHPGLLILASLGTIAQVALTVWLPIDQLIVDKRIDPLDQGIGHNDQNHLDQNGP